MWRSCTHVMRVFFFFCFEAIRRLCSQSKIWKDSDNTLLSEDSVLDFF